MPFFGPRYRRISTTVEEYIIVKGRRRYLKEYVERFITITSALHKEVAQQFGEQGEEDFLIACLNFLSGMRTRQTYVTRRLDLYCEPDSLLGEAALNPEPHAEQLAELNLLKTGVPRRRGTYEECIPGIPTTSASAAAAAEATANAAKEKSAFVISEAPS